MDPSIWTYLGLVVAALILIWALLEVRWRHTRRQKMKMETTWVKLHSPPANTLEEEPLPLTDEENEDEEEKPGQNLLTRAQQNGHYSESKKLL